MCNDFTFFMNFSVYSIPITGYYADIVQNTAVATRDLNSLLL